MIYTTSTDIDAPVSRAWHILAAVDTWPQWTPTVRRVEALDSMPAAVGKRFRLTQPKLRPTIWTVEALEPGHRFMWRARLSGTLMTADHVLEPCGTDKARVILSFAFEGFLGVVMGKLYGRLTRDYIEQEARALKAAAEASK